MVTISISRPAVARCLGGLVRRLLWRLLVPVELWLDWLARHNQRRALMALDERMLRDIGLTRDEVTREGSKPMWRP
jgi:uncharacterized protein YjiS (DUF1127 family)